jgi:hypothetical protein
MSFRVDEIAHAWRKEEYPLFGLHMTIRSTSGCVNKLIVGTD